MTVKIKKYSDIDDEFIQQWTKLFSICFNKDRFHAEYLYRTKYQDEKNAVFAVLEENGVLAACYSGIILNGLGGQVFLSMDTMALKSTKHGTTKVAEPLYEFLRQIGVLAVVGFPNAQVVKIREKFLGWQMVGHINAYVGIPIRSKNSKIRNPYLWQLHRPKEGFFNYKFALFVNLFTSHKMYAAKWFRPYFTLQSEKPGPLFIKIPDFFGFRKLFGYRILCAGNLERTTEHLLINCINDLDVECIDVP